MLTVAALVCLGEVLVSFHAWIEIVISEPVLALITEWVLGFHEQLGS